MFFNRIIFCLVSMFWVTAQAQEIFLETSFIEAVNQASEENKHVYVLGITSWCDECVKLSTETLTDSTIQKALNEKFISIKVDLEEESGLDIAMKYRANPAPLHLFFDANGHLVRRGRGYYDSGSFFELIHTAADSLPELEALPNHLDFTLDYPEWYRDFLRAPRQRKLPDADTIEAFLDSRDSITDEVTWAVLYSLPTPEKYAEVIAANKDILSKRYGKNEVLEKLSSYVYTDVKNAIKDDNEVALHAALRKADRLLSTDADIYKIRYQLYYYQYNNNWIAYAEIGAELARNPAIADRTWLNEIATNIYLNTSDYGAVKRALDWMYPIIKSENAYTYLLTTAQLEYVLGNTDQTLSLAKEALISAEEGSDTFEADRLIELLETDRH